jgi:F-type H+-transporting ATPase subunit alpha
MTISADEIGRVLREKIKNFSATSDVSETGTVIAVGDGICRAYGLSKVQAGELVEFKGGVRGLAFNLESDNVGIIIMGESNDIKEGDTVKRTGKIAEVPVGEALLGRVVDALGNPIDGLGDIKTTETRRIEIKAPGIVGRKSVHEPMQTGIKAIDAMIPENWQDRGCYRHDYQSEGQWRYLYLCCNRTEEKLGCSGCRKTKRARRT